MILAAIILGAVIWLSVVVLVWALCVMAARADDEAEAERRRLPVARRPCEGRRQHERHL